MLYFVLRFPLAYLVCDNFCLSLFFRTLKLLMNIGQVFGKMPLNLNFFDGFPTVGLGLWDFWKQYHRGEVPLLHHERYFSPKTELWSLVQGDVCRFLPCKAHLYPLTSPYSSFWRQFIKWEFGFTSCKCCHQKMSPFAVSWEKNFKGICMEKFKHEGKILLWFSAINHIEGGSSKAQLPGGFS